MINKWLILILFTGLIGFGVDDESTEIPTVGEKRVKQEFSDSEEGAPQEKKQKTAVKAEEPEAEDVMPPLERARKSSVSLEGLMQSYQSESKAFFEIALEYYQKQTADRIKILEEQMIILPGLSQAYFSALVHELYVFAQELSNHNRNLSCHEQKPIAELLKLMFQLENDSMPEGNNMRECLKDILTKNYERLIGESIAKLEQDNQKILHRYSEYSRGSAKNDNQFVSLLLGELYSINNQLHRTNSDYFNDATQTCETLEETLKAYRQATKMFLEAYLEYCQKQMQLRFHIYQCQIRTCPEINYHTYYKGALFFDWYKLDFDFYRLLYRLNGMKPSSPKIIKNRHQVLNLLFKESDISLHKFRSFGEGLVHILQTQYAMPENSFPPVFIEEIYDLYKSYDQSKINPLLPEKSIVSLAISNHVQECPPDYNLDILMQIALMRWALNNPNCNFATEVILNNWRNKNKDALLSLCVNRGNDQNTLLHYALEASNDLTLQLIQLLINQLDIDEFKQLILNNPYPSPLVIAITRTTDNQKILNTIINAIGLDELIKWLQELYDNHSTKCDLLLMQDSNYKISKTFATIIKENPKLKNYFLKKLESIKSSENLDRYDIVLINELIDFLNDAYQDFDEALKNYSSSSDDDDNPPGDGGTGIKKPGSNLQLMGNASSNSNTTENQGGTNGTQNTFSVNAMNLQRTFKNTGTTRIIEIKRL